MTNPEVAKDDLRVERRDLLLAIAVFLAGCGVATFFHWPALQEYGVFKDDFVQSPHWAAYHTTSFLENDLILRYASFNESPLQNAIYWVGTWFVEPVRLGKILSVISYGMLASIFFAFGRAMYGVRFGLLASLFILLFPDQWDYSAGFFSKFWAIPLLLATVFCLQTGRRRWLIGLLPFGAVAYPTATVLVGMTASVYLILEWLRDRAAARLLFRSLAIGSALAVSILMFKYVSPDETIGPMRAGAQLRNMPEVQERGYPSKYIPIPPLTSEVLDHLAHPFVLINAAIFLLVLRRRVGWERGWTALLLASLIGYLLADLLFMRFYIPNRYTRYSLAVLLVLWHARNWDLILARVSLGKSRAWLTAGLVAAGLLAYGDSYTEGRGWTDHTAMTPVSRFIREELPEGILVAGSPRALDDVPIQGKRSILSPYKLAHPWFVDYYDEIRERTRASLFAHFASGPEPLNELHRRYGATHFLIEKSLFNRIVARRRLFAQPYQDELYRALGHRRDFYLSPPPDELILWEDANFALITLPVPTGGADRLRDADP